MGYFRHYYGIYERYSFSAFLQLHLFDFSNIVYIGFQVFQVSVSKKTTP